MLDKAKKGLTAAQRAAGQVYDEAKDRAEGAYEIGRNSVEGVYDGVRDKVIKEPAKTLTSWCSWCGTYGDHVLSVKRTVGRSTYVCQNCELNTIQCRHCKNMAKAVSKTEDSEPSENKKNRLAQLLRDNWNHEL